MYTKNCTSQVNVSAKHCNVGNGLCSLWALLSFSYLLYLILSFYEQTNNDDDNDSVVVVVAAAAVVVVADDDDVNQFACHLLVYWRIKSIIRCRWLTAVQCTSLNASNSLLSSYETQVNSTVVITCDPGYIINGQTSEEVVCGSDGQWSPTNTTCQRTLLICLARESINKTRLQFLMRRDLTHCSGPGGPGGASLATVCSVTPSLCIVVR